MKECDRELKSRFMMYAIINASKLLGEDPDSVIRWLQGRCILPQQAIKKCDQLTYNVSPVFYEVISDPVESTAGKELVGAIHKLSSMLEHYEEWMVAVGTRKGVDGICAINRYGEAVSPWFRTDRELWKFVADPTNVTTIVADRQSVLSD
jgi:hypothetical protein